MAAGAGVALSQQFLGVAVQQSFSANRHFPFDRLQSCGVPVVVALGVTRSSLSLSLAMATGSTPNEALLAAIQGLEGRMNDRITSMKRELSQEREQADERLVKRMKLEKAPTFKRKSHEVQYTFNEEVKSKLDSAKAALQETPPAVEKVKTAIQEGEKLIGRNL